MPLNWDLMWAVVGILAVAFVAYTYGLLRGFKDGAVAMRKEVVLILEKEREKSIEREKTT